MHVVVGVHEVSVPAFPPIDSENVFVYDVSPLAVIAIDADPLAVQRCEVFSRV